MKKLAIVHTTTATIEPLKALTDELLPRIPVINWVDDSILPELIANGNELARVRERWIQYVQYAVQAGASVILSACSSVGELAPEAQAVVNHPVLRIDSPMAEEAVSRSAHIGVAATLAATLGPSTRLLQSTAAAQGKTIQLTPLLVADAYQQLVSGHKEKHDQILADALEDLAESVEIVVLAQASMARVLPNLPPKLQSRFLTSPRSGIQNAAATLAALDE